MDSAPPMTVVEPARLSVIYEQFTSARSGRAITALSAREKSTGYRAAILIVSFNLLRVGDLR